jgi:gliding motility-associated-like protein
MWKIISGTLSVVFISISSMWSDAQINIAPSQTAAALAQKLAGEGVNISNATLTCPAVANGLFHVVSSNLGLDSGIVLTTGRAVTESSNYGVNGLSAYLASTDNGAAGDAMLNVLAGQSTVDACDLEFDVIPHGDSLKFQYVFSSEEYKNAVCGPYNDAFAFFISGPGISGSDNMALVPGTSIPVTINSINDGIPGITGDIINCTHMGAGSPFTSYYVDNSTGASLTHEGFTSILQATHAVISCSTYHLKIVIADAGDPLYDSGVFLEAGSLHTDQYSVAAWSLFATDTASAFCIKGCLPGHFRVYTSEVSSIPVVVKLMIAGNAINGVDYAPIADSIIIPPNNMFTDIIVNGLPTVAAGIKTLKLFVLSKYPCAGLNNITDSASILIYDTLDVNIQTNDTAICSGDSILMAVSGDSVLSYAWAPAAGLSNSTTKNPEAFPLITTTYTVTALLPGTSCPQKTDQVTLRVKLTPQINPLHDTAICYNSTLSLTPTLQIPNLYYNYLWQGPDHFTATRPDTEIVRMQSINSGLYTLSVLIDTNNCSASATIDVAVRTPAPPDVLSPQIFCLDKPAGNIQAIGENLLWYTDSASADPLTSIPPVTTYAPKQFIVYVSQTIDSCESPKLPVNVIVEKCCDGNIFIPTAFTPNGDGLNDKFRTIVDYGYHIGSMFIYNRWGQVVYSGTEGVWDGTINGSPAEVGTYYYRISFDCFLGGYEVRSGDITLIR